MSARRGGESMPDDTVSALTRVLEQQRAASGSVTPDEPAAVDAGAAIPAEMQARVESLASALAQQRRETESLRARVSDLTETVSDLQATLSSVQSQSEQAAGLEQGLLAYQDELKRLRETCDQAHRQLAANTPDASQANDCLAFLWWLGVRCARQERLNGEGSVRRIRAVADALENVVVSEMHHQAREFSGDNAAYEAVRALEETAMEAASALRRLAEQVAQQCDAAVRRASAALPDDPQERSQTVRELLAAVESLEAAARAEEPVIECLRPLLTLALECCDGCDPHERPAFDALFDSVIQAAAPIGLSAIRPEAGGQVEPRCHEVVDSEGGCIAEVLLPGVASSDGVVVRARVRTGGQTAAVASDGEALM